MIRDDSLGGGTWEDKTYEICIFRISLHLKKATLAAVSAMFSGSRIAALGVWSCKAIC